MPRKDLKAYLLNAQDKSGESVINMFLDIDIATKEQIAEVLGISVDDLTELRQRGLPLDNDRIAKELGVTLDRLYRRRYRAGMRLKVAIADMMKKR